MIGALDWLAFEEDSVRQRVVNSLDQEERNEWQYHWKLQARQAQLAPRGNWRTWLILAGRGFGKTRAGAEWVRTIAEENCEARIALISSSLTEARSVMVEGESGILACSPPECKPAFEASLRRVRFPNGAQAQLFSAAEPESLRGPQFSHAWCDETGKWPLSHDRATRAWDNLLMGLRLGHDPRIAVTTTPRAVPLVQRLLDNEKSGSVVVTRGSTYDNAANLPKRFLDAISSDFSGTQLARQEIAGEMLTDLEGTLWPRTTLERARAERSSEPMRRVVVAVDPPISSTGDECGIIVAAIGEDGFANVLADCSLAKAKPGEWAKVVAIAAEHWKADRVVAESNQGGAMVENVLRAANASLPIKLVRASRGKVARAEPVAALYEAGRVRHCGSFPKLEDQMCGMLIGGQYAGPGRSPDRADALVWALTELMLGPIAKPSVRSI
ncbi:terminase family protein [uncultured Erythrobacter sp.]|uniref:DNA-packaging protein n=1 Tax=uncultured Erythrobacter sp. TaxID=263913 RepID=UPI00260D2F65|nr:terminase family protein [uncultured Erythrobacter sp.]